MIHRSLSFSSVDLRSNVLGEMSGSDVYYSLKHGHRLERPNGCPLFIYQIMLHCWQWDEKKRPNFEELYQALKIERPSSVLKATKSLSIDETVHRDDPPSDHF